MTVIKRKYKIEYIYNKECNNFCEKKCSFIILLKSFCTGFHVSRVNLIFQFFCSVVGIIVSKCLDEMRGKKPECNAVSENKT